VRDGLCHEGSEMGQSCRVFNREAREIRQQNSQRDTALTETSPAAYGLYWFAIIFVTYVIWAVIARSEATKQSQR
jgi:hypothetical protein